MKNRDILRFLFSGWHVRSDVTGGAGTYSPPLKPEGDQAAFEN